MKISTHLAKLLILVFLSFLVLNLKAQKNNLETITNLIENSEEQEKSFTGFALYDLSAKKMLAEYNSNKYFIPASNTKLFSFYAGLKILGDSLPALKYYIEKDTFYFTGTGDPSFLNFDLEIENPVYEFLRSRKEKLCYFEGAYTDNAFAPGWAWDDYNYYYSPERSNFPIYGNIIRFKGAENGTYSFLPTYFESAISKNEKIEKAHSKVIRNVDENKFEYFTKPHHKFKQDIPFKTSTDLMLKLLSDTLKREVFYAETSPKHLEKIKQAKVYRSIPVDTLYQQMLHVSDNFMAEQILMMCASSISDSLDVSLVIDYVLDSLLSDMPDKPRWVDGSGLSRYNLFTPRSYVYLLEKIYSERTQEQLFGLLPAGGHSGTLKKWYRNGTGKPYIFAKTGTVSNNHNLSGYLVTKKGEILIFSFMNNHYIGGSSSVKNLMSRILLHIYENY